MLLRFSTENFRSFKNRAVLSLAPNNRLEKFTNHIFDMSNVRILKAAFIYGANASGKSNLVSSISFARDIILDGFSSVMMINQHYRLDKKNSSLPGVFQFDLISNGKVYSYGFSINYSNRNVLAEWLYIIKPSGTETLVFERDDKNNIDLNPKKAGKSSSRLNTYKEDIKNVNATLFLTEIAKKNISSKDSAFFSDINNVFNWFKKLIIVFPSTKYSDLLSDMKDSDFSNIFSKYMKMFDTGINDFKLVPARLDEVLADAPDDLKNQIKKDIIKTGTDKELRLKVNDDVYILYVKDDGEILVEKLKTSHDNHSDLFDLSDESDGTKRLIDLVPLLISDFDNSVVVIDELDRSLHPNLVLKFVDHFFKIATNKNIQLIATTHQAELMDLDILRRDEIWLVERGNTGSKLYSLDDFNLRSDKDINSAYLLGRYGAVPLFSETGNCIEDNS